MNILHLSQPTFCDVPTVIRGLVRKQLSVVRLVSVGHTPSGKMLQQVAGQLREIGYATRLFLGSELPELQVCDQDAAVGDRFYRGVPVTYLTEHAS